LSNFSKQQNREEDFMFKKTFMTSKQRQSFVTRHKVIMMRVAQVRPMAQAQSRPRVHSLLLVALTLAIALVGASATTAKKPSASEGQSRYAKLDLGPGAGHDGARIHYKSYGKGREALVLIHGWSCNMDYWRDSIPAFAKRSRVIAIDLPGHGQSDKPEAAYSMDLFARAVDAVLRDAKVERAVLVGHSMGTPVARQFYRKYPQKTLGIVIVDGPLRPFGDKKMLDGFIAGFRGPNYKQTGLQMFAGMEGPNLSAELKERIQASFLNTPQHVLVSAMEGMADESIWGPDKINVPVLAIMARSPFYAPDTEQFYHSMAPNLDFQIWEGVGHFLMMEKPNEFNQAVIAFLDKNKLLNK
jgi:pimeloyl-ACP methyl ester carboxylesterase